MIEIITTNFSKLLYKPFPHGIYSIWENVKLFVTLKPFCPRKNPEIIENYLQSPLLSCKQIHSDIIKTKNEITKNCEGDGVELTEPGNFLGIVTADCVPIILYSDKDKKLIGLHAGWRGVSKGIIEKGLNKFNNPPQVFIGVSIDQKNYEVQADLVEIFSDYVSCVKKEKEKYFLDLRCIIISKLSGNVEKVFIDNRSSFNEDKFFFSYRREKEYAGRNMLIAGMK